MQATGETTVVGWIVTALAAACADSGRRVHSAPHRRNRFAGRLTGRTPGISRRAGWWVPTTSRRRSGQPDREMFQQGTYDPQLIDRELNAARLIGFNPVRVFLHDLLAQDRVNFQRAPAHP